MSNPRRRNGSRRNRIIARHRAANKPCALCGQPIDKALRYVAGKHGPKCADPRCAGCSPHPGSGVVDEIIPVSRGGDPLKWGNTQWVHRDCNARKGNKLNWTPPNPVTATTPRTSRTW